MRILHLIPSLDGGGAERQLAYLAAGLRALGADVHIGLLRGGINLERARLGGAQLHFLRAASNYDPRLPIAIARLIRRLRPDLVQTWLTQMDVLGGMAALAMRRPWILSERSSGAHYPRNAREWMRRRIGRLADAIVANSEAGLVGWEHGRGRRVIVRNAVPSIDLESVPRDPADYGAAQVILFAGRLDAEKNIPNLLAALRTVVARRNVVALLCGKGPEENAVRGWIHEAQLEDRVRLLGYCENLPALMKRADLLVAPSWFEGHPNVPLEAAAVGCPLVLSDIPSHRDWLGDDAALFASPEDAGALAAAMLRTLDDPAAARARAEQARQAVGAWTLQRAALAYFRLYEELRAGRAGE